MFKILSDIKGFSRSITEADTVPLPHGGFFPDPDRMAGAVRVILSMWMAYIALIYVNGLPGGAGFVSMAVPFVMALATMPQASGSLLVVPAAVSLLFGVLVHIFVMPHLSSFIDLGLLIFGVTFAICYLFAAPRQALGRIFGLTIFVTIASISNEQAYSFLKAANTALMFVQLFLILVITSHVPFSLRPDRAFLRLLSRFFRSCESLVSTMRWDPQRPVTRLDRWRETFHVREMSTLPRKLGAWAPHIDTKALPGTSPQQIQAVVTSLQGLTYRIKGLIEEPGNPQAKFLGKELQADVRAWRLRMQETFQRLSEDPTAGDGEAFRAKLDGILDHLEERIKGALDKTRDGLFSDRDGENFYRLLGAFRGVSEALVNYAGSTGPIDWARWREERF